MTPELPLHGLSIPAGSGFGAEINSPPVRPTPHVETGTSTAFVEKMEGICSYSGKADVS
jgi:hypothetical protein